MQVSIGPEAIEQMVVQAIVQSAIGKQIQEGVQKALASYSLQRSIEDEAGRVVREIVRDYALKDADFRTAVEAAVRKQITEGVLTKTVLSLLERTSNNY